MTEGYTRVKICGLTGSEDRDAAVDAGADALGFITEVPVETPREISPGQAAALVRDVPPFVTSVLVTMPDSVQSAVTLQERIDADAIQIHSGLAPDHIGGLRERIDADVLAAVDADQDDIAAYADAADAVIVDSLAEDGGGGTGTTHDWSRTREYVRALDSPVILAGGLTPGNVAQAVETVQPYGVDAASGIERDGGIKDHDAVRAFVAAAREGVA